MAKKKFVPPWLKVEDETEKPKGKGKSKPKSKGFVPFGKLKAKKGGTKKKGK